MAQVNNQYSSGFDQIGGIPNKEEVMKAQAENAAMWEKIENLVHQVFEQNPQGKELLSIWKEALIMNPTVTPNSTAFQAGIAEGNKEFIRNIYLTVKKVESN